MAAVSVSPLLLDRLVSLIENGNLQHQILGAELLMNLSNTPQFQGWVKPDLVRLYDIDRHTNVLKYLRNIVTKIPIDNSALELFSSHLKSSYPIQKIIYGEILANALSAVSADIAKHYLSSFMQPDRDCYEFLGHALRILSDELRPMVINFLISHTTSTVSSIDAIKSAASFNSVCQEFIFYIPDLVAPNDMIAKMLIEQAHSVDANKFIPLFADQSHLPVVEVFLEKASMNGTQFQTLLKFIQPYPQGAKLLGHAFLTRGTKIVTDDITSMMTNVPLETEEHFYMVSRYLYQTRNLNFFLNTALSNIRFSQDAAQFLAFAWHLSDNPHEMIHTILQYISSHIRMNPNDTERALTTIGFLYQSYALIANTRENDPRHRAVTFVRSGYSNLLFKTSPTGRMWQLYVLASCFFKFAVSDLRITCFGSTTILDPLSLIECDQYTVEIKAGAQSGKYVNVMTLYSLLPFSQIAPLYKNIPADSPAFGCLLYYKELATSLKMSISSLSFGELVRSHDGIELRFIFAITHDMIKNGAHMIDAKVVTEAIKTRVLPKATLITAIPILVYDTSIELDASLLKVLVSVLCNDPPTDIEEIIIIILQTGLMRDDNKLAILINETDFLKYTFSHPDPLQMQLILDSSTDPTLVYNALSKITPVTSSLLTLLRGAISPEIDTTPFDSWVIPTEDAEYLNALASLLETSIAKIPDLGEKYADFALSQIKIAFNDSNTPLTRARFALIRPFAEHVARVKASLTDHLMPLIQNPIVQQYSYESDDTLAGFCGIRNLGATCYINSMLQQLYWTRAFRTALFEADSTDTDVTNLQELFRQIGSSTIADPTVFLSALTLGGEELDLRKQGDAVEFLQILTTKIPDSLFDPFRGETKAIIDGINSPELHIEVNDTFYELGLPLYDSFDSGMATLTTSHKFKDENKQDAIRNTVFTSLPQTLLIQLRRFSYDVNKGSRSKLWKKFDFPLSFNAEQYFGINQEFKLHGVITHLGTADAGHYCSLVRLNDKWVKFSDTFVGEVTGFDEEVNSGTELGSTAYILIYNRVGIEDEHVVQDANIITVQSLFSRQAMSAILAVGGDELLNPFFMNIFLHGNQGSLSRDVIAKINPVTSYFDCGAVLQCLLNAPDKIVSCLQSVILKIRDKDYIHNLANTLIAHLPAAPWRIFSVFGTLIAYDSAPKEGRVGDIVQFLLNFYSASPTNLALEKADVHRFIDMAQIEITEDIVNIISTLMSKILRCHENRESMKSFFHNALLCGFPVPDAVLKEFPKLLTTIILNATTKDDIATISAVANPFKVLTSIPPEERDSATILKHPELVIFPALVSVDSAVAQAALEFIHSLFPNVPVLVEYLDYLDTYRHPKLYTDEIGSIPEDEQPPLISMLDQLTSFLNDFIHNHKYKSTQLVHAIRCLLWLLLRTGTKDRYLFEWFVNMSGYATNFNAIEFAQVLNALDHSILLDQPDQLIECYFPSTPFSTTDVALFSLFFQTFKDEISIDLLTEVVHSKGFGKVITFGIDGSEPLVSCIPLDMSWIQSAIDNPSKLIKCAKPDVPAVIECLKQPNLGRLVINILTTAVITKSAELVKPLVAFVPRAMSESPFLTMLINLATYCSTPIDIASALIAQQSLFKRDILELYSAAIQIAAVQGGDQFPPIAYDIALFIAETTQYNIHYTKIWETLVDAVRTPETYRANIDWVSFLCTIISENQDPTDPMIELQAICLMNGSD